MSIIEATTYLALLAATVYKYTVGGDRGVALLGPIHGVLFLIFAAMVLTHHRDLGWPIHRAVIALVLGSLPFGGFWVERRWLAPLASRPVTG
mgnify:CR=1 FL=1